LITRRKLIVSLGAGALAAPFRSFSQNQDQVWRVGFLSRRNPLSSDWEVYGAFPQGMSEFGYVEGKNLKIEWRFADGKFERLPGLAAELVKLKVDVIVTTGTDATRAAQKATTIIPIVMGNVGDPVASGFVKSLARPEGNITGLSSVLVDISPKHVEMLLTMVPRLSHVAVLVNPSNSSHPMTLKSIQITAHKTNVRILAVEARTASEIEDAFVTMKHDKTQAVIVVQDAFFQQQRRQIAALATKNWLPSISSRQEYTEAGGLMSYGSSRTDAFREAGIYAGRILRGEKPSDLPVIQASKFELVINRKTAKVLGLDLPPALLALADEAIE